VDVSVVAASQRSTHHAVVEKCKVNPAIRDENIFYPKFAGMALRFVFRGSVEPRTSRVLAFTDTLPIKKQREAVEKTFKLTCRADLHNLPFDIYHHARQSNCWLQVVDYCCWSIYRKWENADIRTYDQLRSRLAKSELEVFRRGDKVTYY
jgi:hypothetical protein